MLVGAGLAMIALDLAIDLLWATPAMFASDEPLLNRGPAHLIGRTAVVAEEIEAGRGKVKIGDLLWLAEGPDAPAGTEVTVVDARNVVLVVALR